jgi:hypothetical protein
MEHEIKWSDCSSSQYLTNNDVTPDGTTVTVKNFEERAIEGRNGESDKRKVVVFFHEFDKPMILNKTNGEGLRMFTGCKGSSVTEAIGRKIELYRRDDIEFGGRYVSGLRFRAITDIPYEAA